jgi:hypothetical protein
MKRWAVCGVNYVPAAAIENLREEQVGDGGGAP